MVRPTDLPNYRRPPIDEVALGFQFDRVHGYSDVHSGLLWHQMRSAYPRTESRPRTEVPIEDLESPKKPRLPELVLSLEPPGGGRTWLIDDSDAYLVQVQDSQFMQNWRRRGDDYPQLDDIVERFWSAFEQFTQLLQAEDFDVPKLRQLEVSYFNWIPDLPPLQFLRAATTIGVTTATLGPDLEDFELAMRLLDHAAGDNRRRPIARLSVECRPAFRLDGEGSGTAGHRFTLSYKAPLRPDATRSDVDPLVAAARRSIVNTFTDLTTDEAHNLWERIQ